MNKIDIKNIETKLGIALPLFYKETMLNYPFEEGSFGEEFLLTNDPEDIIDINSVAGERPLSDVFYIGTDGGECRYFILISEQTGKVYECSVENRRYKEYSSDWRSYLSDIETTHQELDDDERQQQKITTNKKWWQFWI